MHDINYDRRNEWYSNNEYDLQKLVGKKYLGMDYRLSDKDNGMYPNRETYEVFLKWEGYIMSFVAPGPEDIPLLLALNEYIAYRLEDWDTLPNHAAQMFILYFEGAIATCAINRNSQYQ